MENLPQSRLEDKNNAETHVVTLVNEKLDEGFELISDEDCDESLHIDINEDGRLAKTQNQGVYETVILEQQMDNIKITKELSDFEEAKVNPEETKIQEQNIVYESNVPENCIQKEFKISSFMKTHIDRIEEQAERFNLISDPMVDKILVCGQKEDVFEFLNWLYAQTVDITEDELSKLKYGKVVPKQDDYQQIEVAFSTFHRLHQNEIFSKANQLELICESAYDMLLVSGYPDNLKEFKAYLQEIEGSAKRALYPKYWDFYILPKFSEIDVQEGTLEFQEVKALFCASLKHMKITKLTRIQNKYLMDNFIIMLQKRQEYRDGINTSRKLLFHGSRKINPRTIYQESDIGFDLQFSNPKGSYGKGLYLAVKSVYSHKFAHKLMNGSYQMLLADVFVGKSVIVGKGTNWVKAPPGYDSIESTNSSYIIYNNFHSYPLYLIEYIEDFDLILEDQNT